jgi:AcrR family transcriptional regulator
MDRFAEATESLLRDRPFEQISIQEIARLAERPIGSFYARFGSKDALLPFLYQRYHESLEALFAARLARVDWDALGFDTTIEALVDFLVGVYDERRWLLRALALFARSQPAALPADVVGARSRVFDLPIHILARHRASIIRQATTHLPSTHSSFGPHAAPHAPQCMAWVRRSAHDPLQLVCFSGQVEAQRASPHTSPDLHSVEQLPQ